ncbi:MAG: DUF5007 domain-containing protein [Agriterribacter sp.]
MKKIILFFLVACASFMACKKIAEGFLSDTLRYTTPDLYCLRGLSLVQSDKISFDGSTPPITFEMQNLRDSMGGKLPEAFNTKYEVTVFKPGMTFNVDTDTTVELLNQKRETLNIEPMEFNTVSGQLTFNRGSANIPIGIYNFDIKATNRTGTKTYPSFGSIHVIDPTNEDMFKQEDNVNNAFSDADGTSQAVKNPKLTFTKVSDEGARIILKITDKNGNPFNPAAGEIMRRGDRPTFENYARFNDVINTDTAMVCDFEVAPFPLAPYKDATTDWGHLIYYRIPSKHITIDGLPDGKYSANPRFAFVIKMEGTFIVQLQLTDGVRKP